VVGSAIAFQLLFGWPLWVGCLVTGLDSLTFLAVYTPPSFVLLLLLLLLLFFASPRLFGIKNQQPNNPTQSDSSQVYQCGAGYFEALIASLIALVAGCFSANFLSTFSTDTAAKAALGLLVPHLKREDGLVVAMGTLGAVIMPHNLYLHSGGDDGDDDDDLPTQNRESLEMRKKKNRKRKQENKHGCCVFLSLFLLISLFFFVSLYHQGW
jgi:NRAMP (natural resistance-associated macrophage protein)-like metal ion transporter